MNNQRLKKFAASLAIILSLVASSLAACSCSHHDEKTAETISPSCHEHSHDEAQAEHQRRDGDSFETIQTLISQNDCCCVQSAPKVYAKSDTVKIEKQTLAGASSTPPIETVFVSQIVAVKIEFHAPFHLTDSFYNIKSPRAPPRL